MKDGWYILNYHDVSWEESIYIRGIGGTCPPDIFREHLAYLSKHGEFVSVQEGFDKYRSGDIKKPIISFWFDEGLRGVRKYAYPLLEKYNVKAAISVHSKFMTGKEMFWQFKLSFLSQVDGMRFLRSRLRKHGYKYSMLVSDFVFDNFSSSIIKEIDAVYQSSTDDIYRKDAFRVFDDVEGIRELKGNGWLISNHSASHYPVGEDSCLERFFDEFNECEEVINNTLDMKTEFWVLPFDRPAHRSKNLKDIFNKTNKGERHLVLVGNEINKEYDEKEKFLYRIALPIVSGKEMIEHLEKIPYHV
jgi:peptidoglycan/xylan/chitin deacetylase (PgdA/CDA1 family)